MTRVYTAVFRPWHEPYAWFGRDSGLVTEGLRQIGVESRLVILETPGMPADERFLPVSRTRFCDPEFWRFLALDAVVLQGGGDPPTGPVSEAIKSSGTKLLLRLDTDGVVAPQVDPYLYLYNLWWWLAFHRRHPAWLIASGKAALKYAFPRRLGPGRIAERLARGDALLVESRIAAARIRRILREFGPEGSADKVHHLPIPVANAWCYEGGDTKENLIVSAARWVDRQKDAPKLVKVLAAALAARPEYRAAIIGNGEAYLRRLVVRHGGGAAARIEITGRLPHTDLPRYERRAKIFLCSSRAESMNISSAEALCCGCSVVGPAEIASMHEYSSADCGTMAWTRRTNDFSDAVDSEIAAWNEGRRDPVAISSRFRRLLSPANVARELLAVSGLS